VLRQAYLRFLVFVSAFYDQRRGKEAYFSEAQKLSHYDAAEQGLRQAFLNLGSGIEDLSDAEAVTEHLIGEMSRKVGENLRMRQDKVAMAQAAAEQRELKEKNAAFFDHVEGLGALDVAVDGLYVRVQPRLGLSHTQARVCQAATS
jgi:microsomal dipeptidase-like Zn-dependent dipeptidase